jgi:hypothetical protein
MGNYRMATQLVGSEVVLKFIVSSSDLIDITDYRGRK